MYAYRCQIIVLKFQQNLFITRFSIWDQTQPPKSLNSTISHLKLIFWHTFSLGQNLDPSFGATEKTLRAEIRQRLIFWIFLMSQHSIKSKISWKSYKKITLANFFLKITLPLQTIPQSKHFKFVRMRSRDRVGLASPALTDQKKFFRVN